jgi:hypothetical protein
MQRATSPDVTVNMKGIFDEQSIGSKIQHPGYLFSI